MNYDGPIVQNIKETAGHGMQEKKQKALHFFPPRKGHSAKDKSSHNTMSAQWQLWLHVWLREKIRTKITVVFLNFTNKHAIVVVYRVLRCSD